MRTRLLGPRHAETARAIVGLADVALARGENAAAITLLDEALEVLRERLGAAHPDVVACQRELERARSHAAAPADAIAASQAPLRGTG